MKKIKVLVLLAVTVFALSACGGQGNGQNTTGGVDVSETAVNDDADSENESENEKEPVATSDNPLCDFAVVSGFDGVNSKDISSVEVLGGELTLADLTSAKDIISKCSDLEIQNYSGNSVLSTSDPEEVLNYTGELGNRTSDDEVLTVNNSETILCVFNEGKVRIIVYNNTDSDITLKDAIVNNKYYLEIEGNVFADLSGDTTDDLMASLVDTFGAPDSMLATDNDLSNLAEPSKEGYNKFTSMLVYKAGDFNLVIKSYEVLQGSDDVKSELTLKFEAFYAEGLQLDGKSFVDYKFNKDGYKEF